MKYGPRYKDLTGQPFGSLIVLHDVGRSATGATLWNTLCSCGNTHVVSTAALTTGNTKSCGCKRYIRPSRITHGKTRTVEFTTWQHMLARCYNPSDSSYPQYGGRGIGVCERWRYSFPLFLEDMGARPEGLTLERKDVDGNYEPENCTWATYEQQARNKRNSVKITYLGRTQNAVDWAREFGMEHSSLRYRLSQGMTMEQISINGVKK
jgi:hypothetical protein